MDDTNSKICNRCNKRKPVEEYKIHGENLTKMCITCLDKRNETKLRNKCPHDKFKQNCKECNQSAQNKKDDELKCSRCHHNKPIENFKLTKTGTRQKSCIECLEAAKKSNLKHRPLQCIRCRQDLEESDFNVKPNGQLTTSCKKCLDKSLINTDKTKRACNKCGIVYEPTTEFFNTDKKGELTKRCKSCLEVAITSAANNKCDHGKRKCYCDICGGASLCEHNINKRQCRECNPIVEVDGMKKCSRCPNSYDIDTGFRVKNNGETSNLCINCLEDDKKSKEKNKCDHGKRKNLCIECGGASLCEHKKSRIECKECGGSLICEHNKIRSKCIKCDGGSICAHKHLKYRCKICDFAGYLSSIVRAQVLKGLKHNKILSTIEYLGCTIEFYIEYLEAMFKDEMTWENHGAYDKDRKTWHIDHIVPVKYKENGEEPTLEETIKRLHYTNTQPLWAIENLSKNNKYIG